MKLFSAIYNTNDIFGLFDTIKTIYSPKELEDEKGMLLIHGGEDISPSIYKQQPNSYTDADVSKSDRDKIEIALINKAMKLKMPIIGICRGAQLLCALNGGTLFQHVNGHQRSHQVDTYTGDMFVVNSVHHQMMNIKNTKHELIAWSHNLSNIYLGENDENLDKPAVDPEIVYFPKYKALAIQPHPEWLASNHPLVQYCSTFIKERML